MCSRPRSKRLQALRRVPAFRDLSGRHLASIDGLVDQVSVEAGHVLAREGEQRPGSFVVVSGLAEVTRRGRRVGVLGAGAFLGETATPEFRPGSFTVKARTPMELLVVGPAALATFLADPVAGSMVRDTAARFGTLRRHARAA